MKLTNAGTIKSDDHNILRTEDNQWMVSRSGTVIGYCDTLAEVPILIEQTRAAIRERLASVEAEAARRAEQKRAESEEAARATKRG